MLKEVWVFLSFSNNNLFTLDLSFLLLATLDLLKKLVLLWYPKTWTNN